MISSEVTGSKEESIKCGGSSVESIVVETVESGNQPEF